MMHYSLPYFGEINLASVKGRYEAEMDLNEHKIRIDLNFQNLSTEPDIIDTVKTFLENIGKFAEQNKAYIDKDFKEGIGETSGYIKFYLEELDEGELSGIIGTNDPDIPKEIQLLRQLKLIRIGLYPDIEDDATNYAIFDYSIDIDGEPCNQVLVVITNEKGDLDHITWES